MAEWPWQPDQGEVVIHQEEGGMLRFEQTRPGSWVKVDVEVLRQFVEELNGLRVAGKALLVATMQAGSPVPDEWPWSVLSCEACGARAVGNFVRLTEASEGSVAIRCQCGRIDVVAISL